jgi:hypothetical protein
MTRATDQSALLVTECYWDRMALTQGRLRAARFIQGTALMPDLALTDPRPDRVTHG